MAQVRTLRHRGRARRGPRKERAGRARGHPGSPLRAGPRSPSRRDPRRFLFDATRDGRRERKRPENPRRLEDEKAEGLPEPYGKRLPGERFLPTEDDSSKVFLCPGEERAP